MSTKWTGTAGNDTIVPGVLVSAGVLKQTLADGKPAIADLILGGAGNDSISGDLGLDTLDGGSGRDTILGGDRDDILYGGTGGDRLTGGDGNDLIADHTQTPTFDNSVPDFTTFERADADTMSGGLGADTIYAAGGPGGLGGPDLIDGGTGGAAVELDTLVMSFVPPDLDGSVNPISLALEPGVVFTVSDTGSWSIGLKSAFGFGLPRTVATVTNIESLVIIGSVSPTVGDSMNAAKAAGEVTLSGLLGNDTLIGGAADDLLSGDLDNDSLSGNAGDDLLIGGKGRDTMAGGAGADGFLYDEVADRDDVIIGFVSGVDRLLIDAAGFGGGLVAGMDLAAAGRFGSTAVGTVGQFIYERPGGDLFWDSNGTLAGGRVKIADLGNGTALAASDFVLV